MPHGFHALFCCGEWLCSTIAADVHRLVQEGELFNFAGSSRHLLALCDNTTIWLRFYMLQYEMS
jgi:hypothetical protein